jgi:OOP family OmpA-OmpF porin
MRTTSLAAIAIPALLLAACGTGEVETLRTSNLTAAGGNDFHRQLAADYRGFSIYELDQMYDTADAGHFARKGLMALEGQSVQPENPASRDIEGAEQLRELQTARARLMNAFANDAAARVPGPAARAQVSYDCWVEQQEEGFQYSDIASCRNGFLRAMQVVEARTGEPPVSQAPAQPAEPLAAVPRDYRVFFDWDSAEVTAGASEVLRQAAENAKESRLTVVRIVGHADRSGPVGYNKTLSERRANAVAQELGRHGLSTNDVAIYGQGETEPLVETGDGVREPQNRRVRVIMGSPADVGA